MSELSNDIPHPEDSVPGIEQPASPAVMLMTITLLTATLILTGAMMLYYAKSKSPAMAAETEKGEAAGTTEQTASIFKAMRKQKTGSEDITGGTATDSGLSGLFGTKSGGLRWPKLELTGFGTSTDKQESFAIINNRQYYPGQLISGKIRLVEVRRHDVVVEYQDEMKTLTIDTRRH